MKSNCASKSFCNLINMTPKNKKQCIVVKLVRVKKDHVYILGQNRFKKICKFDELGISWGARVNGLGG